MESLAFFSKGYAKTIPALAACIMLLACINVRSCASPLLEVDINLQDGEAAITSPYNVDAALDGWAEVNGMRAWETVTIVLEVSGVQDQNGHLDWPAAVIPSQLTFEEDGIKNFTVTITIPYTTNVTNAQVILSGTMSTGVGASTALNPVTGNLAITNEIPPPTTPHEPEDKYTNQENGVHRVNLDMIVIPAMAAAIIVILSIYVLKSKTQKPRKKG